MLGTVAVFAQVAPRALLPASSQEPVVELSPFTVDTSRDTGYAAENTLAGSRLNARLRDTAGSVSVFTKEFLDDLAITDLAGLLNFTVNSEMDTNAWQPGQPGQNPSISGENLLNRTMVRGLAASQGMDYFTSITNMDPTAWGASTIRAVPTPSSSVWARRAACLTNLPRPPSRIAAVPISATASARGIAVAPKSM